MATEYTPNYNLDLYASADKPNLRDQYNAAMGKVDAQMKKSADDIVNASTNVITLQTQMTETQKDVSALTATVEKYDTQIAGAQKAADDALSLAQANETNLAGMQADVTALTGRVTTVEATATKNKGDIAALGTRVDGLQTDASQKVPTDHASAASTYGKGTPTMFGHLKVTDAGTASASTGTAASPYMVSQVGDQVNELREDIAAKPKSVTVSSPIANVSARYIYSPLTSICVVKVYLANATLKGGMTPLFTLPKPLHPISDYDGDVFSSKTANPYGRINYNSSTGIVALYSYIEQEYDTSSSMVFFYGEVPSTAAPA